jgi:hypothetical protein
MTTDELKEIGKAHMPSAIKRSIVPWKHLAAGMEPDERVVSIFGCKFEGLQGGCVVSNRRLLVVGGGTVGALRKKKTELDLVAISQVRSAGFRVEIAGGGTELTLTFVPDADRVVQAINRARRPSTVTSALPAPSASEDPAESLRKLAGLRDAGIVSPEEFAAKKAELLGRM